MYDVQLNAYAYIAANLAWPPITALALIYTEPMTGHEDADPATVGRGFGFVMPFKATLKFLAIDIPRIPTLLHRYRDLVELARAPGSRAGCENCDKLDTIVRLPGVIAG